jgi:hypothetical protein
MAKARKSPLVARGAQPKRHAADKERPTRRAAHYHTWRGAVVPEPIVRTLKEEAERAPKDPNMKGAHLSALYLEWPQQTGIWGGFPKPAIPFLKLDLDHVGKALRELGLPARLKVMKAIFEAEAELSAIAEQAGVSPARARTVLEDLMARGNAVRTGPTQYRATPKGQGAFFDALFAAGSWLEKPASQTRRPGGA